MKKNILIIVCNLLVLNNVLCQKFAYVDTDYILSKMPEFSQAQSKIDEISKEWQKEIEERYAEVDQMYKRYQEEKILLTNEMQIKREEAIIKKETEVNSLQQKYFGPEGSLNLKRQELITPIQDKIYDAIQQLASKSKYQIIFDSSSELIMLYKNNNLDKSDKVLQILGY